MTAPALGATEAYVTSSYGVVFLPSRPELAIASIRRMDARTVSASRSNAEVFSAQLAAVSSARAGSPGGNVPR